MISEHVKLILNYILYKSNINFYILTKRMVSGIGVLPNFNLNGQEKPLTFTSGSTPMSGK